MPLFSLFCEKKVLHDAVAGMKGILRRTRIIHIIFLYFNGMNVSSFEVYALAGYLHPVFSPLFLQITTADDWPDVGLCVKVHTEKNAGLHDPGRRCPRRMSLKTTLFRRLSRLRGNDGSAAFEIE
ncbi:hypothetical protein [Desulfovibrio sp. ZJ369]|uniref:hypothetical protein n=1 Tax=Desulfovibrio sp. ZJ369 TaxID=2709793 RepID=UPI0013ED7CFD|nr:hypothetical protein [Desulfovibrio sp. ZJ369]